jgi:hypothetical protein
MMLLGLEESISDAVYFTKVILTQLYSYLFL